MPTFLPWMYSATIRHRQRVDDIGRSHHGAGERLVEPQGARFVKRHHDMPHGTTSVFVPRLRLRLLNSAESDAKQRPSDQHWHEKQSQPCRPQTNHPPRYPATISPLATHRCPPSCPAQLDRITVYSSRFTLRISRLWSYRNAALARHQAGAATGSGLPRCVFGHSLVSRLGSSLLR